MRVLRIIVALVAVLTAAGAAPASAQFFLKPPPMNGAPAKGDEPGVSAMVLPNATQEEIDAGLLWNLRAGLNIAALQCQFQPSLSTVRNYNAVLIDHQDELKAAYATLGKYFLRVNKSKAAGQNALDQFGTRTYSSFSTVLGQYGFCETAGQIGEDALYAPRGSLHLLAQNRMRDLRASLLPAGEQAFSPLANISLTPLPRFDDQCWSHRGEYNDRKCGPMPAGAGTVAVAAQTSGDRS